MYAKYESYLGQEFSPDYWSDEGISRAVSYMDAFSDQDWRQLAASVKSKPIEWQIRCAETLSETDSEHVVVIIVELSKSDDDQVALAALDSLNALLASGKSLANHEMLKERIGSLKNRAGAAGRAMLESLERKLS